MKINLLDHGFVRHVESYGHGDAGDGRRDPQEGPDREDDYECGIIEAARQSTQANFRSWDAYKMCSKCGIWIHPTRVPVPKCAAVEDGTHDWTNYQTGDKGLMSSLYLNEPQHATPFEFAGSVIEVCAPIFVFREWHRHRTQSYNEMSARYAPLPDKNYVPTVERCLLNSTKNRQAGRVKGADEPEEYDAERFREELGYMYERQETFYQKWLLRGIPKELARIDLPVGRYSQMRAAANLRNWFAFMTLRDDPGAQWEIQQYAKAVGTILEAMFPNTYALWMKKKSPEFRISKFTDDQLIEEMKRRGLVQSENNHV